MKFSYAAVLPMPPDRAFDFVADPEHWPRFFSTVRSAEAPADWGRPGGTARIVSTRGAVRELEVVEWEPPRRFRYVLRSAGHPDADNLRVLTPAPRGTRMTGTTDVELRRGLRAVPDLLSVLVGRLVYRRGMRELPQQAQAWLDQSERRR